MDFYAWIIKYNKNETKKNSVIGFIKQIFTWWHRQTVGTFIYTLFAGKLVGKDEFGNKYYSNSKKKRWVIYANKVESTKIPPEWHLWIHFLTNDKPSSNLTKFKWQKTHEENLTGTAKSHKPDGSLTFDSKKIMKKYETWKF